MEQAIPVTVADPIAQILAALLRAVEHLQGAWAAVLDAWSVFVRMLGWSV